MKPLRPWFELVRLPNVFTAIADVVAGYWFVSGVLEWNLKLTCLGLASASLYAAGIVFNDLRDIEIDRQERPNRPLPSGRISRRDAVILAIALSAGGLLLAFVAGYLRPIGAGDDLVLSASLRPVCVAAGLFGAILLYDFVLKGTMLGPISMGCCRGLNLLLGMSFAWSPEINHGLLALLALTLYVASFTYFGRDESQRSRQFRLVTGMGGVCCGLLLLVPLVIANRSHDELSLILWLVLLIHVTRMAMRAIRNPSPGQVQHAMKTFILGIVVLDATVVTTELGWQAGVCVLALLIPTMTVGRWIYST